MKLATIKDSHTNDSVFGIIKNKQFYSLFDIVKSTAESIPFTDINSYLQNASSNYRFVKDLLAKHDLQNGKDMENLKFLPALQNPSSIIDFALTPQHLANSARTFVKHEYSFPMSMIANMAMKKKIKKMQKSRSLAYYVGNNNAISGPEDFLHWPEYTSYLDIEPELAIVTGDSENPIAGYIIFNDISARDIQVPELSELSLTRSKHFAKSNGFGPFFVPAGEIANPLSLEVSVKINNRFHWKGNTHAYSISPQEVIAYLQSISDLNPGSVIGLGTIPFCCGLDNNKWIEPGDVISITFDQLGTLTQYVPESVEILEPSRWGEREFARGL